MYLVWEHGQELATHSVCIEVREQLVKSQYQAQLASSAYLLSSLTSTSAMH